MSGTSNLMSAFSSDHRLDSYWTRLISYNGVTTWFFFATDRSIGRALPYYLLIDLDCSDKVKLLTRVHRGDYQKRLTS
jgi:hypothetical protein